MTKDLIVEYSLVISVSSTSGLASRGQKEDITLLCSQEKSHPWGVPWWGFILNIKSIYLWMCHLEERKSHSCVFWNGDQRTYSLTSPKMCNNITLLTKTELSDSNISNILLRRCQNIPNVLLVLFFWQFSMLRQNLDKTFAIFKFCSYLCSGLSEATNKAWSEFHRYIYVKCIGVVPLYVKCMLTMITKTITCCPSDLCDVWLFVQVTVTPFKLSSQKENCVTRYVWAP